MPVALCTTTTKTHADYLPFASDYKCKSPPKGWSCHISFISHTRAGPAGQFVANKAKRHVKKTFTGLTRSNPGHCANSGTRGATKAGLLITKGLTWKCPRGLEMLDRPTDRPEEGKPANSPTRTMDDRLCVPPRSRSRTRDRKISPGRGTRAGQCRKKNPHSEPKVEEVWGVKHPEWRQRRLFGAVNQAGLLLGRAHIHTRA